jgi:hypothetical protein
MKKRRLTKAQREWCREYEDDLLFEPMMGDYLAGNCTFREAAQHSINWIRDHVSDMTRNLEKSIPSPGPRA